MQTWESYGNREFTDGLGGQTARVYLFCQVSAVGFKGDDFMHVTASLTDASHVTPTTSGALLNNQNDKRGWFTEAVTVRMSLRTDGAVIPPLNPSIRYYPPVAQPDVYHLIHVAPQPTSQQSTLTSNAQFNLTAGGGVMGPMPVLQVGAGVNVGMSFSTSIEDFEVESLSTSAELVQRYFLASSKGAPYKQLTDLIPQGWNDVGRQFTGAALYDLPNLATSDLTIPSQAMWRVDGATPADCMLNINVSVDLAWLETTFKVFAVQPNPKSKSFTAALAMPLPLSKVVRT